MFKAYPVHVYLKKERGGRVAVFFIFLCEWINTVKDCYRAYPDFLLNVLVKALFKGLAYTYTFYQRLNSVYLIYGSTFEM